ncbi:YihY/virulence factor BrkB family protein [Desulfococcus multivorans]|uniref:Ribonuclease BN n=1 Tax=Desulfococcus multivorans DSM 2059 TaxID=1121405 RepID=S7UUL0_DESML|nr:YihY/virulence factor BrkB family protein [Desulfococcus multivorans]AOY60060.1 Rbn: predicted tRNA-processing ribonuclease BN [Desulfococcus multivorans]AQV02198.1 hypothetical protein B2D07_16460 [Desulfococcus multivorans]EPR36053.1 ribonuclease BN [Desulfococcus multivorans DSM 2059]SJZ37623.1 membrane protein [Desulfococcus multivorans DSM 2059]
MEKLRTIIGKASRFFKTDVWTIPITEAPFPRKVGVRLARVLLLSVRGFRGHQCTLRASALTLYTLLSIVPVAAMAFGIAAGFGFEERLERELLRNFSGQEAVVSQIIQFAHRLLADTQGGLIAGIGTAVLFWTVIKVLGNIESSLNAVWEVRKGRSLGRKVGDYLGMVILAPVLVIVSGSATVFIKSQVTMMTRDISALGAVSPMIFMALKLLPYLLAWILFSVIYRVMPNTRVRLSAAVTAGIIAGTLYQAAQWGYIAFQVGVARNNAIYGSFAALPLFLAWLQLSWLIVLFGAAVSSAWQQVADHAVHLECREVSVAFKRQAALGIVHRLVRDFCDGRPPSTRREIAAALGLPMAVVRELTDMLTASGILSRVVHDADAGNRSRESEPAFQPGCAVDRLTVKAVVDAVEHHGCDPDLPTPTPLPEELVTAISEMEASVAASSEKRVLRDIAAKERG